MTYLFHTFLSTAPMAPALVLAGGFMVVAFILGLLKATQYLWLASLLGAAIYYRGAFAGFLCVIAVSYVVLRALLVQPSRPGRWRAACLMLFFLVTVFTLGRVLHWNDLRVPVGGAQFGIFSLDMWLTLRLVTAFWEVGSGAISDLPLSRYLVWICLPLTLAGPLLRFSQFPGEFRPDGSFWRSQGWWLEGMLGFGKLAVGLTLPALQEVVMAKWPSAHLAHAALGALIVGPIGFYLTTAGYFQLMEVFGRPAGFKIPESFNFPIGRKNISDFWMNWNKTATFVFRDYLFYNRWGQRTYNVYFNTLLLFTLVGLWHAANAYWILWGFLHGLLFCTFLLWRKYEKKMTGLPGRGTRVSDAAARVLTYISVCACWYLPSKILQKAASL